MIWQGDTNLTGGTKSLFDGYLEQLDGSAIEISATTLTTSNILTEMNKVYSTLPAGVRKKGKDALVWFMGYDTAALYEMNLQAQGINTSADGGVMKAYNIEIVPVGGLTGNKIVLGERANFYIGTDLESDFNELKIIDMRDTTGDDSVRFIMKAKLDVAIAYPSEVVLYA